MLMTIVLLVVLAIIIAKKLYGDHCILTFTKPFQTVDGSELSSKAIVVPGKTMFGNALDYFGTTPDQCFGVFRANTRYAKGQAYVQYFPFTHIYNVTTAEDAEEPLLSQHLITKGVVYRVVARFLGRGLLMSTDSLWQFRRKILTPAFHFNILQSFVEVFKEETQRFIATLKPHVRHAISLEDFIPQFTLNSICETALGVRLSDTSGGETYRKAVNKMDPRFVRRLCNPIFYVEFFYWLFGDYKNMGDLIRIAHKFSSDIVSKRREEFSRKQVIAQTEEDVEGEESARFSKLVKSHDSQIFVLNEIIPEFTLNNVCETALGVKLNDVPGSKLYRNSVNDMEPLIVHRLCNPLLYYPVIYRHFGDYEKSKHLIGICHEFSSRIIQKKREEFHKSNKGTKLIEERSDVYGKKKRYAMLDTLLDAEQQGLIDHQGICDEVNTFMFEGYDTTSVCLMFALLNLANKADIQEKCYQEIKDLADMSELTVFDFNKLEYLECVIKETLRLYPSVPFIARQTLTETTLNGLIIPAGTQINVHIFDIMRDPRHFPDPEKFDPDRFRPENTTNRHPFAFVPFSAGPRNCIGQKFAMLEVKVLLVSILKNYKLLPVTKPEDIVFENGIVLRSKFPIKIRIVARD